MKRIIINAILILICFVLQTTFFSMFSRTGIVPNICIILIATTGFMYGKTEGLFVGFICGLLFDIFSFNVIGFNALLLMIIGYLNGYFVNTFYSEDVKLPLLLISLSDLLYSFVYYVFLFLLSNKLEFGNYFFTIIMPEFFYTILISILFYPLFLWILIKQNKKERQTDVTGI